MLIIALTITLGWSGLVSVLQLGCVEDTFVIIKTVYLFLSDHHLREGTVHLEKERSREEVVLTGLLRAEVAVHVGIWMSKLSG